MLLFPVILNNFSNHAALGVPKHQPASCILLTEYNKFVEKMYFSI